MGRGQSVEYVRISVKSTGKQDEKKQRVFFFSAVWTIVKLESCSGKC